MNSTVLCILILLLVLASNYCCYRMGQAKGVNDGMRKVITTQVCVAPDLYRQMQDCLNNASHSLHDKENSKEMTKTIVSNVIDFMCEEKKKERDST